MKKIVKIDGMACDSCVSKIRNILYGLPEVEDLDINLDEKKVEIELNDDLSDIIIKNAIKIAGHFEVVSLEKLD